MFLAYLLLFFFHYAAMGELIFPHWLGEECPFLGPKWLLGAIWMPWCCLYSAIIFRAHWLQWKVWLHILLLLSRELHQTFSLKVCFEVLDLSGAGELEGVWRSPKVRRKWSGKLKSWSKLMMGVFIGETECFYRGVLLRSLLAKK